jgi:hypothetical protein
VPEVRWIAQNGVGGNIGGAERRQRGHRRHSAVAVVIVEWCRWGHQPVNAFSKVSQLWNITAVLLHYDPLHFITPLFTSPV